MCGMDLSGSTQDPIFGSVESDKETKGSTKDEQFLEIITLYLLAHDLDEELRHGTEADVTNVHQHVELRITRGLVFPVVERHAPSSDKRNSPELHNATHWSCNINVHFLFIYFFTIL